MVVMMLEPDAATLTSRSGSWPNPSADDRIDRVVGASPTAMVLTGQAGRIEMVSRQAEHMFGLAYSRVGRTDTAAQDPDIADVVRDVAAMMELPPGFSLVY
jgi:hypothetical protein